MSRSPALAAVAALAAVVVSACTGGATGASAADPTGSTVAAAAPATLTPPPGLILSANNTARLGTVVVDGLGYTLYRFEQDSAQPPTATCDGDCARTWPPVLAEPGAPLTLEGVAQDAVGTVTRSDGSVQVTLGGWPVYRFAADPQPGATDGQGVGDSWFAVTPDGGKAGG
jgi:predicted lipoprotein with Yx(FWY)xxD motif